MSPLGCTLLVFLALSCARAPLVRAADAVAAGRPLSGGQKLVSQGGRFALGFFLPDGGAAGRWYVGIWYHNLSLQTPVWVANRDRPVSDPATSRLAIASDGNLALFDGFSTIVWSTNSNTGGASSDMAAVLLNTGNLVLAPRSNASAVLWQSFDHVGDTWLPGAKLRRDKRTGAIQRLVSWRSRGDPAPGAYTLQLDPAGSPQYVLLWNGSREYWATGNWTGRSFSITGTPEGSTLSGASRFNYRFVDDEEETYLTYNFTDGAVVYRFVMDASGQLRGWYWQEAARQWSLVYVDPKARCTVPRGCGAFGVCSEGASPACGCAWGFSPRNPGSFGDYYTDGCSRTAELRCSKNETEEDVFFRMDGMRLPDDGHVAAAGGASSVDCERACLGDCACSAYAYKNNSCILWDGELLNMQDNFGNRAGAGTIYLRLAASEHQATNSRRSPAVNIAVSATAVVFFLLAVSVLVVRARRRRRSARVQALASANGCVTVFQYRDLQSLTKNFSTRIGGGAFGSVFKGQLSYRTFFAVKKLEGFRQGDKQFRAEVSTLGTIQHVNLIRMLGFCSEGGGRKLLVYEYMPNGSLDAHLFCAASYVLGWGERYRIALGVAKGLDYLHDKCRHCIIHCDVKPENILLDAAFVPKVADFGLAKLLGRDFIRVLTTTRGTIGYLAPEWIGGEAITAKADVFSYGMMLFEILSGRRNVGRKETFFPIVAARRLAEEGDLTTLLDPKLEGKCDVEELTRLCKVACWCIQHNVSARPTMAHVVHMLEGIADVEMPPVPSYLEILEEES